MAETSRQPARRIRRSRATGTQRSEVIAYEYRLEGQVIRTFDTEEEALAHARKAMQSNPESEPEVWDTTTGKPIGPAASKEGRDDFARKVGF